MMPSETARRHSARPASDDPLAACARALADVAGVAPATAEATATPAAPGPSRRGLADVAALRRAHHDAATHHRRAPRERFARGVFDALERERIDALGANRWAGVRVNLDALRVGSAPDAGTDPATRAAAALVGAVRDGLVLGARGGVPASKVYGARVLGDIEARVASVTAESVPGLAACVADQDAFARAALALIRRVGLLSGEPSAEAAEGEQAGVSNEAAMSPDAEGEPDEEVLAEVSDDAEGEEDSGEADGGEADGASDGARDEDDERALFGEGEEETSAPPAETRDEPPVAGVDPRLVAVSAAAGYRVFTRAFDETLDARDLADPERLVERRAELDRHLERQGRLVRRLATRLQRVLLARQRREWQFDLDEGQLDTRRLSRLVTDPGSPLVFKGERDSVFRDTSVTLLIDNSRSMIGRPIMIAAACADILARTLERCGVEVEVLGFTTVELHGGRAMDAWEAAGRPAVPGRLNALRHIVYKSADMPYRSARRALALMLERDILKQNIDGEALVWAASRLQRRPTERRILIVVSDGAPVDTSTLSANTRDYLDRHLDAVVAELERRGDIELAAIGVGHDVGRFYSQAMSVPDARSLAPALLSRLEALFRRPSS